jgi:hypothetical protein
MIPPARILEYAGRHALVDGIPFKLPIYCRDSPVLMAIFPIDAEKAAPLLEGKEVQPFRFRGTGLLVVTVIDYRDTVIGKYIEYSLAIACIHKSKSSSLRLPGIFSSRIEVGQYVVDLPVSSEISVKGGRGIWGMPKHQASLDFKIGEHKVSSQYDLDGQLCTYVEIEKPDSVKLPIKLSASNFCSFRGMLMKSDIYFEGKAGVGLFKQAKARFVIGDHPRVQKLRSLGVAEHPIVTAFIPAANGTLDDHVESWFITHEKRPEQTPEGFEQVSRLGLSEEWLAPPQKRDL